MKIQEKVISLWFWNKFKSVNSVYDILNSWWMGDTLNALPFSALLRSRSGLPLNCGSSQLSSGGSEQTSRQSITRSNWDKNNQVFSDPWGQCKLAGECGRHVCGRSSRKNARWCNVDTEAFAGVLSREPSFFQMKVLFPSKMLFFNSNFKPDL